MCPPDYRCDYDGTTACRTFVEGIHAQSPIIHRPNGNESRCVRTHPPPPLSVDALLYQLPTSSNVADGALVSDGRTVRNHPFVCADKIPLTLQVGQSGCAFVSLLEEVNTRTTRSREDVHMMTNKKTPRIRNERIDRVRRNKSERQEEYNNACGVHQFMQPVYNLNSRTYCNFQD
ncbi:hypothetical protein CBL_01268 [Carabus blaptoides fortunei]